MSAGAPVAAPNRQQCAAWRHATRRRQGSTSHAHTYVRARKQTDANAYVNILPSSLVDRPRVDVAYELAVMRAVTGIAMLPQVVVLPAL